jgi:hypothetical protein
MIFEPWLTFRCLLRVQFDLSSVAATIAPNIDRAYQRSAPFFAEEFRRAVIRFDWK